MWNRFRTVQTQIRDIYNDLGLKAKSIYSLREGERILTLRIEELETKISNMEK